MLSGAVNIHKEGHFNTGNSKKEPYPTKNDVEFRLNASQKMFKVGETVWIKSSNEFGIVEEWPTLDKWEECISQDRKYIFETRVRSAKGILFRLAYWGLDKVEDCKC